MTAWRAAHLSWALRLPPLASLLLAPPAVLCAQTPAPAPPGGAADRALHENPPLSDPQLELLRLRSEGCAYLEGGVQLKKGLEKFQQAAALAPNSAIEAYNVGTAQRKLNNLEEALTSFKQSASLDPRLASAQYSLGLVYRARGDIAQATAAFETASRLQPGDAAAHYQLGRSYREADRSAQALRELLAALQLQPDFTGALYQLYLYYQDGHEPDKAKSVFAEFSRVKKALASSRKDLNDDEGGLSAPIDAPTGGRMSAAAPRVEPALTLRTWSAGKDTAAIDLRDIAGDGSLVLVVAKKNGTVVLQPVGPGREPAPPLSQTFKFAGSPKGFLMEDFGKAQGFRVLAALDHGIALSDGDVKSGNTKTTALSGLPASAVNAIDIDQDGDLDIVADGLKAVFINDGNGQFSAASGLMLPQAALKNFAAAGVTSGALGTTVTADLLLANATGERLLLENQLGGKYEAAPADTLPKLDGVLQTTIADMNNDGLMDIVSLTRSTIVIETNQSAYKFAPAGLDKAIVGGIDKETKFVVIDVDNDGLNDLVLLSKGRAPRVLLNRGGLKFEPRDAGAPLPAGFGATPIAADLDGDGKVDVIGVLDSGDTAVLFNDTQGGGHSFRVELHGRRSSPSGVGATLEVRRAGYFAKYAYAGRPVDVALASGGYAEVLRLEWANGFVENKFKVDDGRLWKFEESERVSGSCPSLYAWDGSTHRYVTDAFISGPMGVPFGPGRYFPIKNQEYLKIPGDALRPQNGRLSLALTEELREAVFLDQVHLYAVDHPQRESIFPNEFLSPFEFADGRVVATDGAVPPPAAVDHLGNDVLKLISRHDRTYPAHFRRSPYAGLAEPQGVEFTLPPGAAQSAHLRLFLTGWFYYFESTSLLAASQRATPTFIWPQLQAWDGKAWNTLMNIGIPQGKDKTVVLDLAGKLPAGTERLRLWTNFELYWDEILVDLHAPPGPETLVTSEAPLTDARLRFHGFSQIVRPASAYPQPERFDYESVHYDALWNPLTGKYTRYGDVAPLLREADSRMAVFGSGDEIAFRFDATGLPPLPAGWTRDFLLYLNGFVKDGDRYTAHPGALGPAPYAGMKSYPYPAEAAAQVFSDPDYQAYERTYQTRDPLVTTGPTLATQTAR